MEYQAVRAHLTDLREERHKGSVYERGVFRAPGRSWRVGLVPTGPGNLGAAAETERAINHFEPRVVLFVGVAGGLKDVRIGDVVAATKVYGYERGKAEAKFLPRTDVFSSSYAMEQRARAEAGKADWLGRIAPPPDPVPRVVVGPIATGEKVVASTRSALWEFLRTNCSDALAVEMEGIGFLRAAWANRVEALVVRGISDLIEGKAEADREGSQELAARHASAFAFEVLAKLAPEEIAGAERARQPGLPPIWNVPHRRNPNFTGREELLRDLQEALASGKPAALTQAITGLGGVGKTQLAAEYAYRHALDYRLVWWVRAEGPATLGSDYAALAEELGLPQRELGDQRLVTGAVRRWLEQNGNWLLVFDNAAAPEALGGYLPRGLTGHVLVTSRNPNWGAVAWALPVRVMPRSEAVEFLCKRTGQADEAAAGALAEELGDLPLALEQAGAYVEATGRRLAEYLELFRTRCQELWERAGPPPGYRDTVATTWELSFRRVEEESPAGADLLRLCAFLAPDDIPRGLLSRGAGGLPGSLSAALADPVAFDAAVAALRRYSLMEASGDALSVHRLMQAVTRDRLAEAARKVWAGAAVRLVNVAFPFEAGDVRTWPQSARLLPHALAAAGHAEVLEVAPRPTARLLNQAGLYLQLRAEYRGAKTALERALKIDEAA